MVAPPAPAAEGWRMLRPVRCLVILVAAATALPRALSAQDWQATLSPPTPGPLPPPRAMHATYRFGWSGFTAATADVHLSKTNDRIILDGKIRTVDLARTLWSFDATHVAKADATTLRPVEVKQTERVRSKQTITNVAFDPQGVTSTRTQSKAKTKRLEMPNLFDLQSALLFVRSQPLPNGGSYRLVVFPGKDPYLVTLTVARRERITVPVGSFNAIALELGLNKISKDGKLAPHKKFRKATVWLSDDADRLLLRGESEVFIGSVFGELQTIAFDQPEPH